MTNRNHKNLKDCYGPWALIAGASEGIGRAFSDQLAKAGMNLVLVSRSENKLEAAKIAIQTESDVDIRIVATDLTRESALNHLLDATQDIEIGLLVYNAGAVLQAELFVDDNIDTSIDMMNLNCRTPMLLAHHFCRDMRDRGRGGIILVSSLSALSGSAYIATYAASKAFSTIFAQSLWSELTQFGVDVQCLIAGATATPAMATAGLDFSKRNQKGPAAMRPEDVAAESLDHLGEGPVWIPGEHNRDSAQKLASLPRELAVMGVSNSTAELYGKVPIKPR